MEHLFPQFVFTFSIFDIRFMVCIAFWHCCQYILNVVNLIPFHAHFSRFQFWVFIDPVLLQPPNVEWWTPTQSKGRPRFGPSWSSSNSRLCRNRCLWPILSVSIVSVSRRPKTASFHRFRWVWHDAAEYVCVPAASVGDGSLRPQQPMMNMTMQPVMLVPVDMSACFDASQMQKSDANKMAKNMQQNQNMQQGFMSNQFRMATVRTANWEATKWRRAKMEIKWCPWCVWHLSIFEWDAAASVNRLPRLWICKIACRTTQITCRATKCSSRRWCYLRRQVALAETIGPVSNFDNGCTGNRLACNWTQHADLSLTTIQMNNQMSNQMNNRVKIKVVKIKAAINQRHPLW